MWQLVLGAFLVLIPLALLLDFWPHRERLNSSGQPLPRDWERQLVHQDHLPDEEGAHH